MDINAHAYPQQPDDAGDNQEPVLVALVQGQGGRDDVLLAIDDIADVVDESRNIVRQSSGAYQEAYRGLPRPHELHASC